MEPSSSSFLPQLSRQEFDTNSNNEEIEDKTNFVIDKIEILSKEYLTSPLTNSNLNSKALKSEETSSLPNLTNFSSKQKKSSSLSRFIKNLINPTPQSKSEEENLGALKTGLKKKDFKKLLKFIQKFDEKIKQTPNLQNKTLYIRKNRLQEDYQVSSIKIPRSLTKTEKGEWIVHLKGKDKAEILGQGTFKKVTTSVFLTGEHKNKIFANASVRGSEETISIIEKEIGILNVLRESKNILLGHSYVKYKAHNFKVETKSHHQGKEKISLILQICNQGDLQKCSSKLKTFEKNKIGKDFLNGLVEIHQKKIVHGDLKIENIFVDKDEQGIFTGYIGDFGSSYFDHDDASSIAKTLTGTSGNASPEQCHAISFKIHHKANIEEKIKSNTKEIETIFKNVGLASDIFAAGTILLDLHQEHLSNIKPLRDILENIKLMDDVSQKIEPAFTQYSNELDKVLTHDDPLVQLIGKCLHYDPQKRPTALQLQGLYNNLNF